MNIVIDTDGTKRELLTWGEIFDRAIDKDGWDFKLKAKDEARWQTENLIKKVTGIDISDEDQVEDIIDEFIEKTMVVLFDDRGNICYNRTR